MVSTVLEQIIDGVKIDLAQRQRDVSLSDLHEVAAQAPPAIDALAALQVEQGVHVIAEVKRASPSKGKLAAIADPAALAASYAAGGASVISVLTEQRRFGGSLADFAAVRAVVNVPVLRKDFIVEDYQVWEARAWGADLVLLIVAALDDEHLNHLLAVVTEAGMHALVEVHDEAEVARAVAAGARIIGVNARDLRTLDVDRTTFARLAGAIPAGVVTIAESGVRGPDDVADYASQGAHAVLVGEALVTGDDPAHTLEQFLAAGDRGATTMEGTR